MSVRQATIDDIAAITRHRAAMFRDMGRTTPASEPALLKATEAYLREAIPSGEYVGWLATDDATGAVVAGAGVQRRRVLPSPWHGADGEVHVSRGRQAIVVNVYTEPAFRRRGLSRRLMVEVLTWSRATGLESLVLHASDDGRPLYEQLGFEATNEMRYAGDLAAWADPDPKDDR